MNINALKERLTSKKVLMTVIAVLVVSWLIREAVMWTYIHEFQHLFNQFNTQFEEQQKKIHQKINDAESDFEKRQRAFDENFERTGRVFKETRDEFQKTMDALDKSALERQKKFDEAFAKAPDELFKQHKSMSDKMFNEFVKESKHRSDYFKRNVVDVDKQFEHTRCFMRIGERPTDRDAPPGLTPNQLEDRRNNIMRIRRELAKSSHCEAYL